MKFKIRTKLVIALLATIFLCLTVCGSIVLYEMNHLKKITRHVEDMSEETHVVHRMTIMFSRAVMPVNDYLITGNKRYAEEFQRISKDVESTIKDLDMVLAHLEKGSAEHGITEEVLEEKEILMDVKTAWEKIRQISPKVFVIPDPVGNKNAQMLMEEIDYKWAYPVIKRLNRWTEIDTREYREAKEKAEKAWRQSSLIMIIAVTVLIALGLIFAFIYSSLFVRSIIAIKESVNEISKGNLDVKIEIKSRDEIGELARSFDAMRVNLKDTMYALQRQERYFRMLIENTTDIITVLNADGTVSYESPSVERVLGHRPGDLIGKNIFEYIHPEDVQQVMDAFTQGIKNIGQKQSTIFRIRHQNGSYVVLESIGVAFLEDGAPMAIVNSRDITERQQLLWSIQQYAHQTELLLGSVGEGIYGVDEDGNTLFFNKTAEKLTDCTMQDLIAKGQHELLHHTNVDGSPHPKEKCLVYATLKDGVTRFVDNDIFWRKDGTSFPVEFTVAPIFDEGEISGAVVVFRDITERKRSEEEIKNLNEDLKRRIAELEDARLVAESANNVKSEFLANMSHELNTPLNHIVGFSQVLQDGYYGELNEKQKEYVSDILNGGRRLTDIIDRMMEFTTEVSDMGKLDLGVFRIKDVLEGLISMFGEKAITQNLQLSLNIEPEADVQIEADHKKLKQIMFNLLSNAVKFTPDGGSVRVNARTVNSEQLIVNSKKLFTDDYSLTTDGNFIEITIEDTGIGIKPEDIPKLFQEFTQLDAVYTKRYAGTGLGLALCRKFVEMHNGKIWAESEFGKGSKFSFVLPVRQG